ncbi:MAG: metal ABC transporter permease, partial [Muribaculaceae bacterium]|nr:metal ABC transporter permease [Muribaculaceae bacterium]
RFINCTMTVMVAVGIVLTIRLVGIMLLMSMMTLPQMTAENFCHRFRTLMYTSTVISVFTCLCGLLLSTVIDVPCSALIVIIQATVYAAGAVTARVTAKQ